MEIAKIRILDADDIDWIPSLVHKNFLDHNYIIKAIRITDAGRAALNHKDQA
ncbi:hypothetical protein [Xanthobacter versatilis]|uniref:hypothetical protein n=1 Tax=Xanthobacter autotrophicus (strain ATCC BAA-1158 / Py2) TaxID=78245 RepID=UPI0037270CFF